MVSKAVPILIGVVLVAAAILGVVFVTSGEIRVGEPFAAQYAECVGGLSQAGAFVEALSSGDVAPCSRLDNVTLCEAVVLRDEQRCGGEASCIALVRQDASQCPEGDASCLALVSRDPSRCNGIAIEDSDARAGCAAMASYDVGYFSSRRAKQNCLDSVVFTLSVDESHCDEIADRDVRSACRKKFS